MTDRWQATMVKDFIKILRPGGWVMGVSGKLPHPVALMKGDLIRDLKRAPRETVIHFRLAGDNNTGRWASNRRTVYIYLGS